MDIRQLRNYFNRKDIADRKPIKKMHDNGFDKYKFLSNNETVIFRDEVERICKNFL